MPAEERHSDAIATLFRNRGLAETLPVDERQVFTNVQQASRDSHLPAFQTCCACR